MWVRVHNRLHRREIVRLSGVQVPGQQLVNSRRMRLNKLATLIRGNNCVYAACCPRSAYARAMQIHFITYRVSTMQHFST